VEPLFPADPAATIPGDRLIPDSELPRLDPALADVTPERIAELIDEIKLAADKLVKDRTSRGDVKLLSRTLRELRYAFKVFAPYRNCRKVTIFGSARTPSDKPAYRQAVEFGRRMAAEQWMVVTGAAAGIMQAGHEGAGREHSMGLNILRAIGQPDHCGRSQARAHEVFLHPQADVRQGKRCDLPAAGRLWHAR
jgi:hypothetical protein